MVNKNYKSTKELIEKLQSTKGQTKLKFYQHIGNYYDEMNYWKQSRSFQYQKEPYAENLLKNR